MGLTVLPTRGAGQNLGPTLVNNPLRPVQDESRDVGATFLNYVRQFLEELGDEVGLADGTTVGSLVWLLKSLNGQQIRAEAWTPACTAVSNLDSVTGGSGRFVKAGGVVGFGFQATIDATAASAFEFRASLPVPSAFVNASALCAVVTGQTISLARAYADATNDAITVVGTTNTTAGTAIVVVGWYEVLP